MADDDDTWILDAIDPFGHGRPDYYDREGNPLSLRQWGALFENDPYKRVAQDYLDEGNIWVSTVWIGLDHNFRFNPNDDRPHIFETMVFVRATEEQIEERRKRWVLRGFGPEDFPWEEVRCGRYATEEEARDGHREAVDALRMKIEIFEEYDARER